MRLTIKVCVVSCLGVSSGAKVDEFQLEGLQVDQQVLILDIPMDHSLALASHDRLHHLPEEVPCKLLLQTPLLRDEIEEILARLRTLHDYDEGVVPLVAVDESDDAGSRTGDHVHEADLHGHPLAVHL